jgi:hypothetical protein
MAEFRFKADPARMSLKVAAPELTQGRVMLPQLKIYTDGTHVIMDLGQDVRRIGFSAGEVRKIIDALITVADKLPVNRIISG